jgi:hypothetical protein
MNGRQLAGADGDLFLSTDGTYGIFDDQEAWPDAELARAAWERARRMTWRHEDREDCRPPEGACAWDGLTAGSCDVHVIAGDRAAAEAVIAADLASVAAFRERDPGAAASVADELAEWETALQLLAGLVRTRAPRGADAAYGLIEKATARNLGDSRGAA